VKMSRGVLSSQNYQYSEQGYLVDNTAWQDEIKKRLKESAAGRMSDPMPTLDPKEFQPFLLPENPEAEEESRPPEPTAEEVAASLKIEAEEKAKSIEQAARKNAFEIIEQARWEANDLIAKAKEEADKEVQALKDVAAEEGRKLGVEKGHQEGFEKGKVEGLDAFLGNIQKWNGIIVETLSERKRILGEIEPILSELVGEALHQCLKKEGEKNSQLTLEMAREVLKKAQDRVHLKLHMNPADVEEVGAQKDKLQLSVGAGEIEIIPDARIEKGGCVLETEAGSVDGRLSTVAAQVKDSLGKGLDLK